MGYSVYPQSGVIIDAKLKRKYNTSIECEWNSSHTIPVDANYCPHCGKKLIERSELDELEIFNDVNYKLNKDLIRIKIGGTDCADNMGFNSKEVIGIIEPDELYTCPDPQTLISKLHELEIYKQIADEFEIIAETPFMGIYHSY